MKPEPSKRTAIATRLRAARTQAGLSQGQVAKLLKLQRPSVSEIEAGRRNVTASEITQLSKIFGVSISWLADGSSEESNPQVELAARELVKLKKEDLDVVLNLLKTLKEA